MDGATTCEDLLNGLCVLRHLLVDTKTLLEDRLESFDGIDCSPDLLQRKTTGGHVSRIMVTRLNRVANDQVDNTGQTNIPPKLDPARPKVSYYRARFEEDPLPDPSLLDPIDSEQHNEINAAMEGMQKASFYARLQSGKSPVLTILLSDHRDIFLISFSSGQPARLPLLKIELTPDAGPIKVRLRNYSQDQRDFLAKFVEDLVCHGHAYLNQTSKLACVPLLVPKPGAFYRFTSELLPVNIFTIRHRYLMPNLKHELTKLGKARYYVNFDFSHSYWQLILSKESQ